MKDIFELNGLKIKIIVVGMVQTNCYILANEATKEAVVVDPGDQAERIVSYVRQEGLTLKAVLLTHGHFDHITGVNGILSECSVPVYAWEEEKGMLEDSMLNCSRQMGVSVIVSDAKLLKDKEVLEVAGFEAKLIGTPGHTRGSCCFYFEKNGCLFSGDTLFLESVGRTDLPTGNGTKIIESVNSLMDLPDDIRVFPGHGPATTIQYERANNPFVGGWA